MRERELVFLKNNFRENENKKELFDITNCLNK